MSESSDETPSEQLSAVDPRDELASIVEDLRAHMLWMSDAGVRFVRTDAAAPASTFAPAPAAGGRARPAFDAKPAATMPPPMPPRPAAPPPPAAAAPLARPVMPTPAAMPARPSQPAIPPAAMPPENAALDPAGKLKLIREDLGDCVRCGLSQTRTKIVFGQGNPHAEVLFLGEGPGADEDQTGLAFVGAAGQLLTKMIGAMGYAREDVYICNIVKCRPPGNRKPEPVEIERCRPFVERQIRTVQPKVIVALGATATQALLRVQANIGALRGTWQKWEGIDVMPTFHPSYLLRVPEKKGEAWDDLKLVLAKLGRAAPGRKS